MPPEPTFSRSHLTAFRSSVMAPPTRSLPHQAAAPSCCHRQQQLHATRTESDPWTAAAAACEDDDDEVRSASASASCATSPSSSPLSSPPATRPPSTTADPTPQNHIPVIDDDGTITPATIYEHYERVAQRLFGKQPECDRALDWPPLDMDGPMTLALDELPISPNSLLPEYQLTQEWFERVVKELREAEESRAAGVVGDAIEEGH